MHDWHETEACIQETPWRELVVPIILIGAPIFGAILAVMIR